MIVEVDNPNPQLYSKFNSLLKNGNVIVLYYANWCGHCQSMKPEWDRFKEMCKSDPKYSHLQVAEVESEHIANTNASEEAEGFPTIKFYKKNTSSNNVPDEAIYYQDERVADKFMDFATTNTLKEHVDKQLNNNSNSRPNNKGKKSKKQSMGSKKKKPSFKKTANGTDPATLRKLVFGNNPTSNNQKTKTKKAPKKKSIKKKKSIQKKKSKQQK
jgi:thiol-disulfide isomerase/thioredoxin